MMKILGITAALIFLCTSRAFAQNDSTRYINGLPVSEDDTARQFLQTDLEPKDHLRAVPPDALPSDVLKALDRDALYNGWRDSTVYYDRNTSLFMIHIKSGQSVKIIGMNDRGKPVTFSEVTTARE